MTSRDLIETKFPEVRDGLIWYKRNKESKSFSLCYLYDGEVQRTGENRGYCLVVDNNTIIKQAHLPSPDL